MITSVTLTKQELNALVQRRMRRYRHDLVREIERLQAKCKAYEAEMATTQPVNHKEDHHD